jgi:hypothetical protein
MSGSILKIQIKSSLFFSDKKQIVSIVFSFLSTVISSARLFYSQRLADYLEVNPSIKMVSYAALFIIPQILFPFLSLVLMVAYIKGFVIIFIALIVFTNAIVLKLKCLKRHLSPDYITDLYNNKKQGDEDSEEIFLTAIFTSWIAPCTVWSNNNTFKSYFLITSSLICLLGHALGIVSVYLLTYFGCLLTDVSQSESPPFTHCFEFQDNTTFLR